MNRYEILILTIPEITKDEESSLENLVEKFINDHKGAILTFDRWGKYRLSYPVRNNDYGVYFLMRFDVDNDKEFLKELQTMFYVKFNDIVMRHIVTKLKKDQPLEYKKPPSLEDTPKKRISMFEKSEMKPRFTKRTVVVEAEKTEDKQDEVEVDVTVVEVSDKETAQDGAVKESAVEEKVEAASQEAGVKVEEPSQVEENNQEQEV